MDNSFAGQVALVTGGGKGIGRAIAGALAGRGAKVVVTGRDAVAFRTTAEQIGGHAVQMDVRDAESISRAITDAVAWGGKLDILVNNAGIGLLATPMPETTERAWRDVIETNLTGPFMVTQSAWPHLVAAKGQILNISSIAGTAAFSGASAYCASKFGLNGFTEVLKIEGAPLGIRVLAMCPGAIATDIWGSWADEAEKAKMMTPEQIGELAAIMLSTPRNIDLGHWRLNNVVDPFSG